MARARLNQSILSVRVPPELFTQLDALRKAEADLPNKGEMIRRLVERAHASLAFTKASGYDRYGKRKP